MFLEHKDYKEITKAERVIPNVKTKIRTFVGIGKKSYEEIVRHVQETDNMTNDEVISQIKEVSEELAFIKPIIKEVSI